MSSKFKCLKLKDILSEKPDHHWTVQKMAEIVDLSQPHLHRMFKIHIGAAPMAFLGDLRLENARDLVENTSLQMKQICFKVGILDGSHFTHNFKKKFGTTPTGHRRLHQEKIQAEELSDRIGQEMIGSAKQ